MTSLCETLLRAYAANLVHLHVWEPEMATAPSSALWPSALARVQAARGSRLTPTPAGVEVPDSSAAG